MATDLSALEPSGGIGVLTITLSGTPDELLLVTWPGWARRVSMRPEGGIVKYASKGKDGEGIGVTVGDDFQTVADGTLHSIAVKLSGVKTDDNTTTQIRLASTTASLKVRCTLEPAAT